MTGSYAWNKVGHFELNTYIDVLLKETGLTLGSVVFVPPFVASPAYNTLGSHEISISHEDSNVDIQRAIGFRIGKHMMYGF